MSSKEAPKLEDTTDGGKSAEVAGGESATTTQGKTKKSMKEEQTVMANIESLYFADTFLFPGLLQFSVQSYASVRLTLLLC